MAKTLTAQRINSFNPLSFITENNTVIGFIVRVEVDYGDLHLGHQLDLWPFLNPGQQAAVQQFHDTLKAKLEAYYL